MSIASGTKFGPYEILAPVGAGGMGEVYRARDTRLDRTVAIKVLPQHLSDKPELKQRLEREAKSVSNLSHPNICTLYDVGEQGGSTFLVLEFLEGETLEQRLEKGPLPAEQVLRLAIEITDALEKAHKQGIIHRDLKPSNIMLTKAGAKLMDFGLAKLTEQPTPMAAALSELTAENRKLTAEGTIIGTFQYMAPEQLEGREADARTDLFALGMVIYEAATGKPAFTGRTKASLIASILTSEPPPISTLQPMTPPALERVVKTCLAKDPDERFQTAHDLNLQLRWIAEGGSQAGVAAPVVARRKRREWAAWGAAAAAAVLAAVFGTLYLQNALKRPRVIRSTILPPAGGHFSLMAANGPAAFSPDGTRIVFVATAEGHSLLWVRALDSPAASRLEGTDGAFSPFWSPDGRYIAFFASGKLKKVEASGGPSQVICAVADGRGGSWGVNGDIVFSASRISPIYRVSANGGEPVQVTKLVGEERSHRWPFFLPDGRHFVYLGAPTGSYSEGNQIKFASLDGKEDKVVVAGASNPAYASGQLLYLRGDALVAQRLDARKGMVSGEAVPIASRVHFDSLFSSAAFSVSQNGLLVYQAGSATAGARLLWYDRRGTNVGQVGAPDSYGPLALAPDGKRLAVSLLSPGGGVDIWVFDLDRSVRSRLTFSGQMSGPHWSPDGRTVVFYNYNPGHLGLYIKPADGSGTEQALLTPDVLVFPMDWSRDGKFIAYQRSDPKTNFDIWILPMSGDRKPFPFVQTPFLDGNPKFSPDGKWIAYQSDESGRSEVYVAPFPGPGGKWQISSAGGTQPHWSRDGKELYFLSPTNQMMAAPIRAVGSSLQPGNAAPLFTVTNRNFPFGVYDVDARGRFIINTGGEETSEPLTVVENWEAELKKK